MPASKVKTLARRGRRNRLIRSVSWAGLAGVALVYVFAIPIVSELARDPANSMPTGVAENRLSLPTEISFRAAKLFVLGVFTFLGACLGSFLNVVADSLPRGQAIGLRSSACSQCGQRIRLADNLPIYSYISLLGYCRNCRRPIPFSYLTAELVGAVIFATLFVFELVTGGGNIASFPQIWLRGILYIILYPNATMLGIYFLHACALSGVLLLALLESNGHGPGWLGPAMAVVFAVLVGLFPLALPVAITDHLTWISLELPARLEHALRPVLGGLLGLLFGVGVSVLPLSQASRCLPMATLLSGVVLGWQGLAQVAAIFVLLFVVLRLAVASRLTAAPGMTGLWLGCLIVHQPFWRAIDGLW